MSSLVDPAGEEFTHGCLILIGRLAGNQVFERLILIPVGLFKDGKPLPLGIPLIEHKASNGLINIRLFTECACQHPPHMPGRPAIGSGLAEELLHGSMKLCCGPRFELNCAIIYDGSLISFKGKITAAYRIIRLIRLIRLIFLRAS